MAPSKNMAGGRARGKGVTPRDAEAHTKVVRCARVISMVWKHVRKWFLDLRTQTVAKWKLAGFTLAYVLQLLALVAAVALVLHGWNLYPQAVASQTILQQSGEHTWIHTCNQGTNAHAANSRHVNCEGAFQDSRISPSLRGLEDVLQHLLSDMNLFKYLVPSSNGALGYFVLKIMDNLISYTFFLLAMVVAITCWYFWSFYTGPYKAYHNLQRLKHWERPPSLADQEYFDAGMGYKVLKVKPRV